MGWSATSGPTHIQKKMNGSCCFIRLYAMYVHSPSPSAPLKSLEPYVNFFFFFFDEQTHMFHRRDKPAISNWIEMKEASLPSWLHVTQLLGFLFIYLLLFFSSN